MSPPTVSTRGAPRLLLRILPPSAVSHGAKPRVRAEMDEIWDIWMFNANSTSYNQESHGYLVCGNPSFNRSTRKWYGSIVATGPAVRRHASQKSHRWRYSRRNLPTEEYLSVLLCVLPQFRYSVRTIIVKAGHLPQGPLEVMLVMAFCFFTTVQVNSSGWSDKMFLPLKTPRPDEQNRVYGKKYTSNLRSVIPHEKLDKLMLYTILINVSEALFSSCSESASKLSLHITQFWYLITPSSDLYFNSIPCFVVLFICVFISIYCFFYGDHIV